VLLLLLRRQYIGIIGNFGNFVEFLENYRIRQIWQI